jgi:hypothetical protein
MTVGLGARHTNTRHHVKILATTSSYPNPETLTTHVVLAHPHTTFHPYTCGLCGGAVTVVTVLIGYDNVGLLSRRPRGGYDRDRLLPL